MPDKVFRQSDAESVLLVASRKDSKPVSLRIGEVYKDDLSSFYFSHRLSYESGALIEDPTFEFEAGMWLPPLQEVWRATARMRRLNTIASVHRGIEYQIRFRQHVSELVSDRQLTGFAPGLHRVEDGVEPYHVSQVVYLNISPDLMRTQAHMLPWDRPKLVVNAVRRTRGRWKIAASIDHQGLVCYQNFHGVWPRDNVQLEVLAAILNGPVANAYIASHEGQRHVRKRTIDNVPVPEFRPEQQQAISSLVHEYIRTRFRWLGGGLPSLEAADSCMRLLKSIDAEVLRAYDLPPRVERALLDFFSGQPRPGPVEFVEYFPENFRPHIPWHRYVSEEAEAAKASETLKRLPVIDDPLISEALARLS